MARLTNNESAIKRLFEKSLDHNSDGEAVQGEINHAE